MKLVQIIEEVNKHRTCSPATVRRHMRRLNIKPIGSGHTRPKYYPDDSGKKILADLGVDLSKSPQGNGHAAGAQDGRVVSLKKLQTTRAASGRGK